MGLLDRLLGRMDYEALEEFYKISLSENIERNQQIAQLKQNLRDSEAAGEKLKSGRLFLIPSEVRGKLLKDMLSSGQKDFNRINGADIYLADRHSTVYELVRPISISDTAFRCCRFDRACFDNVFFNNVTFNDVSFNKARFAESGFDNCVFKNCDFTGSTGCDVRFTNCRSPESNIHDMCLTESEPADEENQDGIDRYLYEVTHPEQDFGIEDENDFEYE